jgi:Lrp/AsnC family leucine-responsive transcriptional regulator
VARGEFCRHIIIRQNNAPCQNIFASHSASVVELLMMSRRPTGSSFKEARPLDRIDRLILKALQKDGRKSVSELAREVHLTTSPCLERVRRLEEIGYIQGYMALLNPHYLGVSLLAFAEIQVDRTTPESCQRFRNVIDALPEVMECHKITGAFDYLLKLRVADMEAYRRFLDERLTMLPGVARSRTYVVMEEIKSTTAFEFQ